MEGRPSKPFSSAHTDADVMQMRRITAVERLKEQMEKRVDKWQQYARRLERKAGARVPNPAEGEYVLFLGVCIVFIGGKDVAPDTLDDLCDELEEGEDVDTVIQKVSPYEAGWLAQHMHDRCSKERETFSERVEDEVKVGLPVPWWRCTVLKAFRIFALRERSRTFA